MVQVLSGKMTKGPTMLDRVITIKPTPRVERLREAYLSAKPRVSIDKARTETRVMRETEGEPMIARRAKAFAATVREMPIDIYRDDLLVCYPHGPRSVGVSLSPLLEAELKEGRRASRRTTGLGFDPFELSDEDIRELKEEIIPYWRGEDGKWERTMGGRNFQQAPQELKDLIFVDPAVFPPRPTPMLTALAIISRGYHYGHNVLNYVKVVKKGLLGIKKEAEERLARVDLADPEEAAKVPFLRGVAMAMEAAAEFGKRFAARARELAEVEEDALRKAELLKMAEVCDRVPANPARTFHEALQSYYFAWLMTMWDPPYHGEHVGRMDQYLYPYYEVDIGEGRITKEEAQELIDCYCIMLAHAATLTSLTVGGVKADGSDATNELSYMFIEGVMHTRLTQPAFSVHIHPKMPDDFLIKACQLCALGTGHPQFLNSDVSVDQALARGVSGGPAITLEDARAATAIGCSENGIPGKEAGYLHTSFATNLAGYVELVMTNGWSRSAGRKVGVETGDPRRFTSFEEVREAYRKQLAWMTRMCQITGNLNERSVIDLFPTPYESALISDCIEKGICREEGGAHYNFNTGSYASGSTDAGDSLTAIKKLVFDDKKVTMAQLCDALDADFEGHEDIRKMCLEAPKFGNDDDYADEQVAWVHHQWVSEVTKIKNLRGGYCSPGGSPMSGYVALGREVGALPSGRLTGEPLEDGHSPSAGRDLNGPTAVLKSMGKIDNVEITGGAILNLRIEPAVFDDGDVGRLADLLRAFIDQKIYHVQINVVSSDTLRAAQEEPEKHRDLMVKVAGYNAYFTQLNKPLQEGIIARTEHGL